MASAATLLYSVYGLAKRMPRDAGAQVRSVGVSAPLPAASGGWMGSRGPWGRLAERPVANARRLGALKARQFLSPGHRPGYGIVNEIEPYRGGISTVHGRRTPGIVPLWGLESGVSRVPRAVPWAEELRPFGAEEAEANQRLLRLGVPPQERSVGTADRVQADPYGADQRSRHRSLWRQVPRWAMV